MPIFIGVRWCQIQVQSSKMRVFSFDRYIFRMKFPTGFTYRNLHSFARFPGDSTALVKISSQSRDMANSTCMSMTESAGTENMSYQLPFIDTEDTIRIVTVLLDPVKFSRVTPVFCQIFLYSNPTNVFYSQARLPDTVNQTKCHHILLNKNG